MQDHATSLPAPEPSTVSASPASTASAPPGARIQALYAVPGSGALAPLPPLEELLLYLQREISRAQDPREAVELKVRAALLAWDGRGQVEQALRLLHGVDHPVATALRLQAALDAADNAPLLRFADEASRRSDGEEQAELGELLLWRGEFGRAAEMLERAAVSLGSQTPCAAAPATTPGMAGNNERARQLRAVALQLSGKPGEAVEVLSLSQDPQSLLQAAQLAEDVLSDAERARTLLRRVLDKPWALPLREQARALERLYDLEARRPVEAGRTEMLRRKLELLGGIRRVVSALEEPEPGHVEVFLTALLLAQSLERTGSAPALSEAVSLLAATARYSQEQRDGAAHLSLHAALRTRARVELSRGAHGEAALVLDELSLRSEGLATVSQRALLASPSSGESLVQVLSPQLLAWAKAYGRRAAELWESRVTEGFERARSAYQRLLDADPEDSALALSLVRLLLRQGGFVDAAQVLDRHAQALGEGATADQLRAARAAEAVRETRGVERWLEGLAGERGALEGLLRLHRRRADRPRLCQGYRKVAALSEPRRGAAYLAVAGALALEALPARDAEALLDEAARGAEGPGGQLVVLAQCLLYRKLGRHDALVATAGRALSRVLDSDTQAALHLAIAAAAAGHLGDGALAQRSYQRVLELKPGDVAALHALARHAAESGNPEQAATLLRQAVESALRGERERGGERSASLNLRGERGAALLLCELGALYESLGDRLGDNPLVQATAHYDEAARLDPQCKAALRRLAVLYRRTQRSAEELEVLERLLPLCTEGDERLAVLLRLGEGAAARGTPEPALAAYEEALRLRPGHEGAQAALEALCRQLSQWERLLGALEAAPRTPRTLRLLEEACERLERWEELARFREEELAQPAADPKEVLRTARALAELYEGRLQQPDAAARAWERAYQINPEEALATAAVPAALERLYTAQGRHSDLLGLLAREVAHVRHLEAQEGGDQEGLRARRRELMLRQAVLQAERFAAPDQAAALYEQVLGDWPDEPRALSALTRLYESQDRPEELRRVLERRARSAADPTERQRALQQVGEMLEKAGGTEDLERAQAAYREAYTLDPGNRAAFTALERVCYRRERWEDALHIYEAALALVEGQRSRAYRLGDLYARRGQVLMQYLGRHKDAAQSYLKALEHDAETDANQAALERIYSQAAAQAAAAQTPPGGSPPAPTSTSITADGLVPPVIPATASASPSTERPVAAAAAEWAALIAAYERRAALVRDDGKRVEILRRAARVAAAKLKDIPEAIRLYQKLHAVDPTDNEALDALERHYERTRDAERLIALLSTRLALSTTEQESVALNLRVATLCEEGLRDHNRAIEAYKLVLELQPTHREALDAMARLFEATERWGELVEATRRQIRLINDRAQKALLYFKCGSVMEAKFGKEDDAIRYYDAAVKTSPSCLPAVHGLRDIYLRRKDWPRVTQTLELEAKLWTEDKERAGIYAHIGQIYRDELHDQERAIQYYESALAVDKECLPANRALFEVFYARGDWQRAVPMGQVLSAKVNREGDPQERSEFYRKRAIVAEHTGDLRVAAESLVVALETQPENMEALELLVSLCRRDPSIYDFAGTFRELEKLYRRRTGLGGGGGRSTQSMSMIDAGLTRPDAALKGLGLSLVARAVLSERACEVEAAEELLAEASRVSPLDYAVVEALVTLHERLRRFEAAREGLMGYLGRLDMLPRTGRRLALQARARLRLGEMYSEAAMEPERAVTVLRELCDDLTGALQAPPAPGVDGGGAGGEDAGTAKGDVNVAALQRVARYRLAQELYLLGRYGDARLLIAALIDDAVQPSAEGQGGSMAPPEELARYYDYLGRITEALGDGAGAQRSYRRAVDLDPAYALPVLALARRAVSSGDRAQGELLIREALAQAAQRGDPREELMLMRGVARLLAPVDVSGAVASYRRAIGRATEQLDADARAVATLQETGKVEEGAARVVAWETLDDRVAMADLLLHQGGDAGLAAAREELQVVLQRDLRHAPAYRLLAQAYERKGEPERAGRVLAALGLLGYGEGRAEQEALVRLNYRPAPRRGVLSDENRLGHLLPPAMASPYLEVCTAISEALAHVFPAPWPPVSGELSAPALRVADAAFKQVVAEVQRLHGSTVEVIVARRVPGGVLSLEPSAATEGRAVVLMEQGLLDSSEGERRFLLGRALEPLRGGYAVFLRLRPSEQREVERLLHNLLLPEGERDAASQEFARTLPKKATRVLERFVGVLPKLTPAAFLALLPQCADRAGLLACDDIAAAVRGMARVQGEELAYITDGEAGRGGDGAAVLLGQVAGGAELVRYFLSDAYHELRARLRDASPL